jgi:hypothetical protein
VEALARVHTPEAIRALVAALSNPRERVQAASVLLDRGWGKPTQRIAGDPDETPIAVSFEWAPATAPAHTPVDTEQKPVIDAKTTTLELVWQRANEDG